MRRIETASSPSASAIRTAVSVIVSSVSEHRHSVPLSPVSLFRLPPASFLAPFPAYRGRGLPHVLIRRIDTLYRQLMRTAAATDRPRPEALVRDRLVDDLNDHCNRLGCSPFAAEHEAAFADWPSVSPLAKEEERLIAGLRAALARQADPRRNPGADGGEAPTELEGVALPLPG